MASGTQGEKTRLLRHDGPDTRYVYSNLGMDTDDEISRISEQEEEIISNDGPVPIASERGGGRQSLYHANEYQSAEELLYRMNFSFLDQNFEAEAQVREVQLKLPEEVQQVFKEKILDKLKENSLPLKEKLKVVRVLHGGHRRKKDQERAQYKTGTKTRKDYWNKFFSLWEGSIKMLAAYFGSNVASYFTFLRILLYLNFFTGLIMFCFTTLPSIFEGAVELNGTSGTFGMLSESLMFYGAYTDVIKPQFNFPMSYILTWFVASLLYLVVLGVSMNIRYRRSKLAVTEDNFEFSTRVFTSWDHSITTKDGTRDHIRAFCTELKEKIQEESEHRRALIVRLVLYVGRFFSNIFVMGLLGGSGYLIYYVAVKFELPSSAPDFLEDLFKEYQLSVVVAGLKLIVPIIFSLIAVLESWHPRTELKITLARTTLFYFASLVIFISSLYNVATQCLDNSQNGPGQENTTIVNSTREFCCWENQVGEEVFKLILIDLGIAVAVGLVFHILKAALVKTGRCFKWVGYSQFNVTTNVLDLVYGQGLVWLGLYVSPVIALVGCAKLIFLFYLRYIVARLANVPPKRVFRASRSGNFYLFLLLIVWFLCILPQAYVIVEITPSWDCGPFKMKTNVLNIIGDEVGELPGWLDDILSYIVTPAVVIPVLILLVLVVLYYKIRSSSYNDLARQLRNQLIFERKVEKRKVFARAIAAPAGSYGKAAGSAMASAASRTEIDKIE